jgi:glycine/D-amino acid oxidase-like deaminating enzyme
MPYPAGRPRSGTLVTLIGAGIVNLITALRLSREGYRIAFCEAGPDPRAGHHWSAYGCTHGGGNARMFTLTEADSYHDHGDGAAHAGDGGFGLPLTEGGWRLREPRAPAERRWIGEHGAVSARSAQTITRDIYRLNQEARRGWEELTRETPRLFAGAGRRDGILRLHTATAALRRDTVRQAALGAVEDVLTPAQITRRHPALAGAADAGLLAGGIEVVGFTVQIHDLVRTLVTILERDGAAFRWNHPVEGIRWNGQGHADGLITASEVIRSDHYVISPGAYGGDLLRGTSSHELIQGVVGVWLTVPEEPPGLTRPLKLFRAGHVACDSNITPIRGPRGERLLTIGSGYGWTGLAPDAIDAGELEFLYRAVEDTLRRFLPRCHRAAPGIAKTRRLCVRPWTAAGLGVFEQLAAGHGRLIITGGHNTGGFAQAPAVAEAVLAALREDDHPMHRLYDPARLRTLTGAPPRPRERHADSQRG